MFGQVCVCLTCLAQPIRNTFAKRLVRIELHTLQQHSKRPVITGQLCPVLSWALQVSLNHTHTLNPPLGCVMICKIHTLSTEMVRPLCDSTYSLLVPHSRGCVDDWEGEKSVQPAAGNNLLHASCFIKAPWKCVSKGVRRFAARLEQHTEEGKRSP